MRRQPFIGCAAVLAALTLCGCPFRFSENLAFTRDIKYGSGYVRGPSAGAYVLQDLFFDLLVPTDAGAGLLPAVLLVHGGGFTGGSRGSEDLLRYADALAREGYACFLMDYRVAGENPPAPAEYSGDALTRAAHAAFVDTKVALRHIRAKSALYGVDPNRIAVFGESAGAFAALAAGMTDAIDFLNDGPEFPVPPENNLLTNPLPQAVISFWGNADRILDEFDPTDPPLMVAHGWLDENPATPYFPGVTHIVEACLEHGIDLRLYTLPLSGHGAWNARVDGVGLAALSVDFLDEVL
ncbi:MAG: alpha/beta fold hydrolase [Candidatus Hydrogenedentes bacterium]|nr:alpha/beta fold hydrolase [Candidatus Hydrogenedentota bacterium]